MKVRYDEGLASRIALESCAYYREVISEGLTEVRAGQPLSRDRKKVAIHIAKNIVLYASTYIALSGLAFSQASYSPYVEQAYPMNVYWGDTHIHTNLSMDANLIYGNINLDSEQAYRFAKGEAVTTHNGMRARLGRPLDFVVVADHAFYLGVVGSLRSQDSLLLDTPPGEQLYKLWQDSQESPDPEVRAEAMAGLWSGALKRTIELDPAYKQSVWQRITAIADKHNSPHNFTAFIGYEWTSFGSDKNFQGNLHRVVIFEDGADKADQIVPFSFLDGSKPEDLWRFLDSYEKKTGGKVLAIPHNGNLSNGEMFSLVDSDGYPLSEEYIQTRSRWEPIYEVTQIKGDGEASPLLSPSDQFADYETWEGYLPRQVRGLSMPEWVEQKKSEYARSALKLGLDQQAKLAVNPFKFGMIGSTDTHTSLATAEEK